MTQLSKNTGMNWPGHSCEPAMDWEQTPPAHYRFHCYRNWLNTQSYESATWNKRTPRQALQHPAHWPFSHHWPPQTVALCRKIAFSRHFSFHEHFIFLTSIVLGALLLKAAHAPYRNSKQAPNPFCHNWMKHLKPKPWCLWTSCVPALQFQSSPQKSRRKMAGFTSSSSV